MPGGSLSIGDLVLRRLRTLEASCPQCGRHGQLSVARLNRDYGAEQATIWALSVPTVIFILLALLMLLL